MPQTLLPCFPTENTLINGLVSFCRREGSVYYFHGCLPVFTHAVEDVRSFRMFTSQLVVNGNCTQAEVVRAFGISSVSMKRYVKLYRASGPPGFFKEPGRRGATVLTAGVSAQAQALLSAGVDRAEVARGLGLKPNTLAKAIRAGRLVEAKKKRRGLRSGGVDEKRAEPGRQPGGHGNGVYAGGGAGVCVGGAAFGSAEPV